MRSRKPLSDLDLPMLPLGNLWKMVLQMYTSYIVSKEALARLIKQIQQDNHGGAGLIIPFMSQEYIQAMLFWIHRQHSLGLPYNAETFNRPDAIYGMEKMREQDEADDAAKDLIKAPEVFKKEMDWLP